VIEAAFWAVVAASSLLLGAVVAERFNVPARTVAQAMAFGAGALVAAVAYELVPNARVDDLLIWFSFGAGALIFYLADGFLESRSAPSASSGGTAIALGALLDGIPESVVLGMSVAQGGAVSVGFLVAVFVSNIPESLASTAEMRAAHPARWVYMLWVGIVIASGLSAMLGYAAIVTLPGTDGRYVQALAGGAVLTMLTSSLIPQAYEDGGREVALLTALGFGIAAVLTLLD
jgi:ZIP family zinc transporter